jgi:dephospho-CoA kinase
MRVGLTGGIGSGKTLVAHVLRAMGYPVFFSDLEAKKIVHEDKSLHEKIRDQLGDAVFNKGLPSKERLSQLIFQDPSKRQQLNALIHPLVRRRFDVFCDEFPHTLVFNEAAILFETGAYQKMDANVLVTAPETLRLRRIVLRDNCSKEHASARMQAQWPDNEKIKYADYVLVNDEATPLLVQLERMVSQLLYTQSNAKRH